MNCLNEFSSFMQFTGRAGPGLGEGAGTERLKAIRMLPRLGFCLQVGSCSVSLQTSPLHLPHRPAPSQLHGECLSLLTGHSDLEHLLPFPSRVPRRMRAQTGPGPTPFKALKPVALPKFAKPLACRSSAVPRNSELFPAPATEGLGYHCPLDEDILPPDVGTAGSFSSHLSLDVTPPKASLDLRPRGEFPSSRGLAEFPFQPHLSLITVFLWVPQSCNGRLPQLCTRNTPWAPVLAYPTPIFPNWVANNSLIFLRF